MERKYAVGYRKPPTHSRFKKGKSGNPKGRTKGSRNFSTDVKATLEESIRVTSHGKAKTVSTQLAALLRRRRLPDAAGGRARSALHCSTGCLSMLQKLSMPLVCVHVFDVLAGAVPDAIMLEGHSFVGGGVVCVDRGVFGCMIGDKA